MLEHTVVMLRFPSSLCSITSRRLAVGSQLGEKIFYKSVCL